MAIGVYILFFLGFVAGLFGGVIVAAYMIKDRKPKFIPAAPEEDVEDMDEYPEDEDMEEEQEETVPPVRKHRLHKIKEEKTSWVERECDDYDLDTAAYISRSRKRETKAYNYLKNRTSPEPASQMHPEMELNRQQEQYNMLNNSMEMNRQFFDQ